MTLTAQIELRNIAHENHTIIVWFSCEIFHGNILLYELCDRSMF